MRRFKPYSQLSRRSLTRHFNAVVANNDGLENNANISDSNSAYDIPDNSAIDTLALVEPSSVGSDSENLNTEDSSSIEETRDYDKFFWKFKYNVNTTAVNALLVFLKNNGHPYLPADSRSLLHTPRVQSFIDMEPGKYKHFGLRSGLNNILSHCVNVQNIKEILISFNIDGVPIAKSSNACFWTVLAKASGVGLPDFDVFVVGLYHGSSKPKKKSDFLRPHVVELKILTNNFIYDTHEIKIIVNNYICDAPARALVSCKGHAGYSACSKCVIEGSYNYNRMIFLELDSTLRTNESFRSRQDDNHHNSTSPFRHG